MSRLMILHVATAADPRLAPYLAVKERDLVQRDGRFIVEGRGLFHIHPPGQPVVAIEVEAGDLIRVPHGTHHWFDLCPDRRIRAIRLFQDPSGWTPRYTESGVDKGYQPVCFGPAHVSADPR